MHQDQGYRHFLFIRICLKNERMSEKELSRRYYCYTQSVFLRGLLRAITNEHVDVNRVK